MNVVEIDVGTAMSIAAIVISLANILYIELIVKSRR